MSKTSDLIARREAAVSAGVGHVHPIFAASAKNAEIWDVEDKRFIDFSSGIGVVNTGHLHPKVRAAAIAQLDYFSHTCIHVAMYEPYIKLAERLNELVPGDSPKKTLLMNSGSEAIENAIKVARKYTGRTGIIAFNGGFHGRTLLSLSLTGRIIPYKAGYGPFVPEVFHAPFPNKDKDISIDQAIEGLEQLFKSDIEKERVAAFIIEPVQGEGGFYTAPPEFLQRLREIADQSGILLIADEIQCGFARSGKMFACEYSGIEPDLITLAKGLAGGYPISALVGKKEIMDSAPTASLGGTYGGNPIACAAALAVIDVMEEEKLPEKALHIGEILMRRFKKMAESYCIIGDIRGLGSLVAIELFEGGDRSKPSLAKTMELQTCAREKGLILLSCGINGNVIRFLPPLTIEQEILEEGLDIIEACFQEMEG
ncbi:MAG TPA: 4-aminobutyrate--2-oxoglutarate transaminase [Leucothrix mucor]|nr:4-aminobutyrate--2-oxoglutarate transaminase [Leucothrix mucor]